MCGVLYSFSLYVYTVYIFISSLAFILFVSRWYSSKEILLNQTLKENSHRDIENVLRCSSIPCYRQSMMLQCRPNHRYLFVTWLTHKNKCQLRNTHSLMPSQTKCVLQKKQWERFFIMLIPERHFTCFKIEEKCNKRQRWFRLCGYLLYLSGMSLASLILPALLASFGLLVSAQVSPPRSCPPPGPRDNTVLLPNPTDCSRFFSCSNGIPVPFRCPGGLHFNNALQTCDWPDKANCVLSKLSSLCLTVDFVNFNNNDSIN